MRFTLLLVCLAGLVACTSTEPAKPTEAVCPDPDPLTLTWDNFGQKFFADYCTVCHSSQLRGAQRNGAPLYHDLDTLRATMQFRDHVDQQAGAGPAASNSRMPPDRCPSTPGGALNTDCRTPTEAERTNLAVWLACEANRGTPF